MSLLYVREENNEQIIVTFKHLPLIFILFFLTAVLSIILVFFFGAVIEEFYDIFLIVFVILILGSVWKPFMEIRKAKKEGRNIQVLGSIYSFANPKRTIIRKIR